MYAERGGRYTFIVGQIDLGGGFFGVCNQVPVSYWRPGKAVGFRQMHGSRVLKGCKSWGPGKCTLRGGGGSLYIHLGLCPVGTGAVGLGASSKPRLSVHKSGFASRPFSAPILLLPTSTNRPNSFCKKQLSTPSLVER